MRTKIFVLVILIFCLLLTGCGAKMESVAVSNESMFVLIEKTAYYKIVYHRDTKVMYAISNGGYNAGNFTVMLDPNGKPLLYQEERRTDE